MNHNGTQDDIIEEIYNQLHCDFNWKLMCRGMLEDDLFSLAQQRIVPHYWKYAYLDVEEARLTCRDFIEKHRAAMQHENQSISQNGFWRYDEAFALKST